MNVSQRGSGNTNILKEIQKASKEVSQSLGFDKSMQIFKDNGNVSESAGAYNSIKKIQIPGFEEKLSMFKSTPLNESLPSNEKTSGRVKFDFTKSSINRIMESIESVSSTKEYVNTIQSLLSLYAMGYLDSTVLGKLPREDLNEIKGILKEFTSIIDGYM